MTGEVSTETRDWAELPRDVLATVLGKVGSAETLMSAFQVCRSWCRAASDGDVPVMIHTGGDRLLLCIATRLPSLRSLRLVSCYSISNEGFVKAIKKFPLLEELEISLCKNIFGEAIEAVGKSCPHLKRFRLSNDRFFCFQDDSSNDHEAQAISTIPELRSLELFGNNLTNRGLTAILDSCTHLELLDIRHCFNVKMDAALEAKCARIRTVRLPDDLTDDYEFEVKSPIRFDSNFDHDLHEQLWANVHFEQDGGIFPADYEIFQDEDIDLLEVDGDETPFVEEIPEDEESMMLDYYESLYESGWNERSTS